MQSVSDQNCPASVVAVTCFGRAMRTAISNAMSRKPIGIVACGMNSGSWRLGCAGRTPPASTPPAMPGSPRGSGRDQHEIAEKLQIDAQLRRQQGDNRVHADLAARPADEAAVEKHAADNQKQHDLLGPRDRHREKIPADDVGEVDGDAADQQRSRDDANDRHQRVRAAHRAFRSCARPFIEVHGPHAIRA